MARQKKFREQKRWLRSILVCLGQPIDWINQGSPYEDIKFCDRLVVDGRPLRSTTRRAYLTAVFDFMVRALAEQPADCRLVFILREDNLLSSRAIIFFNQGYYEHVWRRNWSDQTWLEIDSSPKSFLGYDLPQDLPAKIIIEKSGKQMTRLLTLG